MRQRADTRVVEALSDLEGATSGDQDRRALAVQRALRASVRAVLPGRQQKGNLTPLMDQATTAFLRSLRAATMRVQT